MPQQDVQPFTPPTAEQVQRHLDLHPPRGPSRLVAWLPILALAVVLLLTFVIEDGLVLLLPWLLLGAFFLYLGWRVRAARQLEARATQVQELAMLRRWPQSLRQGWRLLPSLTHIPELHGRVVASLAHDLDQLKAYEAAIVAYDFLIARLPAEHPGAVQLRVQRAMAQLASHHLTDADETLRRLRQVVDAYRQTTISAAYRLANLIQQIQTNHFADAVAEPGDLLEELRPLGVDAGYGHALLALAYSRMDDAAQRAQAGLWWARATRLLSPPALCDRFGELAPLTQELAAFTSSHRPWGANA